MLQFIRTFNFLRKRICELQFDLDIQTWATNLAFEQRGEFSRQLARANEQRDILLKHCDQLKKKLQLRSPDEYVLEQLKIKCEVLGDEIDRLVKVKDAEIAELTLATQALASANKNLSAELEEAHREIDDPEAFHVGRPQ